MKSLRIIALATFGIGVALLIAGFAFRGGGGAQATPGGGANVQATPTNTPIPSATATALPTNVPTPTQTPTPFAGETARLLIPRFGVDSAIEEIGISANNELQTPKDPLKTGWYYIYDRPGWGGNAVFSAHVDYYPNILGPFHKLSQLELNDEVDVVMANGQTYKYRVVSNHRYSVSNIPMGDIIWPKTRPATAEWITLITCGGDFVSGAPGQGGYYLHRDVVVAERIK